MSRGYSDFPKANSFSQTAFLYGYSVSKTPFNAPQTLTRLAIRFDVSRFQVLPSCMSMQVNLIVIFCQ